MIQLTEDDWRLIRQAVLYYANARHDFANAIAQKTYRTFQNEIPTTAMVTKALNKAKRMDELVGKLTIKPLKEDL